MTETEKDVIDRFEKYLYENTLSKEFYVSLLKLAIDYSGATNVSTYAKENGITPQGVNRYRKPIIHNGIKFVI